MDCFTSGILVSIANKWSSLKNNENIHSDISEELIQTKIAHNFNKAKAVFLVMCDPSMNELQAT
jgi:hypothetical protein